MTVIAFIKFKYKIFVPRNWAADTTEEDAGQREYLFELEENISQI